MPDDDRRTLFSCRCGRTTARSWYQPPACVGCYRCNTNLTPAGVLSTRRLSCERYNEDMVLSEDGQLVATVEVCKWCGKIDDRVPYFTAISL